jgi:hypothetical protein
MNFSERTQLGFIAQEVEGIVPEVVFTDEHGFKGIAYQSFVPLLAQAIKEQQQAITNVDARSSQIEQENTALRKQNEAVRTELATANIRLDEQAARIARLEALVQQLAANGEMSRVLQKNAGSSVELKHPAVSEALLYQNDPNPFDKTTHIGYYLPESVVKAELVIYQATNGKEMRRITLEARGNSEIAVNASEFESGSYYYMMLADGNVIAGKNMIVVK